MDIHNRKVMVLGGFGLVGRAVGIPGAVHPGRG